MAGTSIRDRVKQALQAGEREIIKNRLKRGIGPYLEVLESECGFCQGDLDYLVKHNVSFFEKVLPQPWRQEVLGIVAEHRQLFDGNEDDVKRWARVFAEAMVELRPWIILPWPYLQAEITQVKAALVDFVPKNNIIKDNDKTCI